MISTLQAEMTNLDSIHTSYRPLILAATQLLKNEPSFTQFQPLTDVPGEACYLS